MQASAVMFGIEAATKIGRKIYEVLIDGAIERPLLLPVGDLYADFQKLDAQDFFDEEANRDLIEPGGPYHGFSQKDLLLAYKSLVAIDEGVGATGGEMREALEIVRNLNEFEQYKKGFGSKPAVQRILGTLVEIGVDHFTANPDALAQGSGSRRIVLAFISQLDETDFAEGTRREIVGDLLGASLRTLNTHISLIDDDERTQALLGGITDALISDIDELTSVGAQVRREDLFRRIGSSLLRGAAGAFTENIDLFMRDDDTTRKIVQSTLTQVLAGIEGKEDLFTNESVELIFDSALSAVGDNAEILADNVVVQAVIRETTKSLTSAHGRKLFSDETVSAVVQAALVAVRDNAETLIDPDNPQEQLLASAVGAMARSLASSLAGGGNAKDLLSKTQLVDLTRVVFQEVAKHPEQLIGAEAEDEKMTAVAQIIGSVARALGENPSHLVDGAGFAGLVRDALSVAVQNADKLIDFGTPNTSKNLLFQVLHEIVLVVDEEEDPRGLFTREVFLDTATRVMPLVSANLERIVEGEDQLVRNTVGKALELASDVLENRTNGTNLPLLIEELLRRVLWGELNLDEETAVVRAATAALRAAA